MLGTGQGNCPFTTGAVSYVCVAATGVTQTSATIGGETTDPRATRARFVVTPAPAGGQPAIVNLSSAASTTVTGLTPNTDYTFVVQFLPANSDTPLGSSSAAGGCPFRTGAVSYTCVNAQAVTQTSARVGGQTNDPRVTQARFVLDPAPPAVSRQR